MKSFFPTNHDEGCRGNPQRFSLHNASAGSPCGLENCDTEPSYFSNAHSGNIFVSRNVITVREHMEICLGVI